VLTEIQGAQVECRLTPLGRRYGLVRGDRLVAPAWGVRRQRMLTGADPVAVSAEARRTCWWFEERFYWADDALGAADVLALVRERERRRRRRLERAHAALAGEAEPRRAHIARETRLAVYTRDGGRCAECGSGFELQYDHLIPLALGGGDGVDNLQLLCGDCNRRKGAALG
jgi:5-methylcytosine-specific restriction endonuclease McrA